MGLPGKVPRVSRKIDNWGNPRISNWIEKQRPTKNETLESKRAGQDEGKGETFKK